MARNRIDVPASRDSRGKPVLAITLGDPSGIGPEVVLRALSDVRAQRCARYILVGSDALLRRVAVRLGLSGVTWDVARGTLSQRCPVRGIVLVSTGGTPSRLAMAGRATAAGGRASVRWIARAVKLVSEGVADGLVTAPISKDAIRMAGEPWPGHTELLAELTGAPRAVMMMAGAGLRVALVTTHVAIRALPARITRARVLETIRIAASDLGRYFGISRPRLGVCGLNPHAGERGRFGTEEQRAILPAVEAARSAGILCEGPLPADTAYIKQNRARYDALVAMYHDQACIPVKMLAFDRGVNVTLGLPIVRTSPDHGTAYDIAEHGTADPGSMLAAIRTAAEMVRAARGRT